MEEINQHEQILSPLSSKRANVTRDDIQKFWDYVKKKKETSNGKYRSEAKVHAITPQKKYPFPRDDSTKSEPRSPGSMGKRPCRHCGSPNHWDNNCKHAVKKTAVKARVYYTSLSPDEMLLEEDYDRAEANALCASDIENDQNDPDTDESKSESSLEKSDF